MIPLLDLTYLLAARGLSLTVVVTPANLPTLDSLLHRSTAEALSVQPLVLPFPTSPTLPPGVENAQHLAFPYYPHLIQAPSSLWEPIELWFRAHPSPPVAIISDFFAGWTQHLARSLGIRRITFYSSGALVVSAFHSVWTHLPQRPPDRSSDDSFPIQLTDVPGSPTLPWTHLPQIYRRCQISEPVSEFLHDSFVANESSWGSVINSFRGLEAPYLDHLGRDGARVWAVGPMLPDAGQVSGRGGKSSVAPERVLEWLDSKPDRSVVYVCFGSQAVLSNLQMERLGSGLESSGVDFLWCVKGATTQALPEEYGQCNLKLYFFEETSSKYAVPTPEFGQTSPMRSAMSCANNHPIEMDSMLCSCFHIHAFRLHKYLRTSTSRAGRASAGEGPDRERMGPTTFATKAPVNRHLPDPLWLELNSRRPGSGVPLLAWPTGADQYLNARLIVDELGVGVRVCEGGQAVPDPAALAQAVPDPAALAQAVVKLVRGANKEGARAAEMKVRACRAVAEGGSSIADVEKLVKELRSLCSPGTADERQG